MFATKKGLLEEEYSEDLAYFDQDFTNFDDFDYDFADSIFDFLQGIIDEAENDLEEAFVSDSCADRHFRKHCKRNISKKRSRKSTVYYDFCNLEDYLAREAYLAELIEKNVAERNL